MRPARAVARRTFSDARIRNACFGLLFAFLAFAVTTGYRNAYPTLKERLAFAAAFGLNKAVQLFYGVPHQLLTVGGYTGWRLSGTGSIIASAWGVFAAVRALRSEEDAGRQELVLAGAISRRGAYAAVLAALGAGAACLWLALFAGLVAARLPAGGSAYLALAVISPALVFAGVGALASQLASTRRLALQLGLAFLTIAFLLRVVADLGELGWLRWATPLGWTEELRPFAGPAPAALALFAAAAVLLFGAAGAIAGGRDVGRGLLEAGDSTGPHLRLLSSPTAQALRSERGSLAAWLAGVVVFALIVGVLSTSFSAKNISTRLQKEFEKLGGASLTTPAGALSFYFLFFVLTFSLFACSQIAAAMREETDQQLETLLAQPVSRTRWLTGRLLLAAVCSAALALVAGSVAWIGAAAQHAHVSLPRLLEGGANCLPATLLFLGVGALAFGLAPRSSSGVAYGFVLLAFVWDLVGSLLGVPHFLLEASPFRHVGLVPARPFHGLAAVVMLAIGVTAAVAGVLAFRRRDLAGN